MATKIAQVNTMLQAYYDLHGKVYPASYMHSKESHVYQATFWIGHELWKSGVTYKIVADDVTVEDLLDDVVFKYDSRHRLVMVYASPNVELDAFMRKLKERMDRDMESRVCPSAELATFIKLLKERACRWLF